MNNNDFAVLSYEGKDYEIRYTFDTIRKMKAYNVNLPKLFVDLTSLPTGTPARRAASLFIDDIVDVLSALLRIHGCDKAKAEDVHAYFTREGIVSLDEAYQLVIWLGVQYYNIGKTVSAETTNEKKQNAAPKRNRR